MSDLPKSGRTDSSLPSPSDFPIGSVESRAAARALAQSWSLPVPDILTVYVKPLLDAEDRHIYGGQPCESERIRVDYGIERTFFDRDPGETFEDFLHRVATVHPKGRYPRVFTPIIERGEDADMPAAF
jgi:hypothetical protein